jgi:hypothetical protein
LLFDSSALGTTIKIFIKITEKWIVFVGIMNISSSGTNFYWTHILQY